MNLQTAQLNLQHRRRQGEYGDHTHVSGQNDTSIMKYDGDYYFPYR